MTAKNTEEQFWDLVEPTGFCWYWTGPVTDEGYGHFSLSAATSVLVHRTSYELLVGPIPAGLQLDHLCFSRNCVNPDHLEPITASEHSLRSNKWRMQRRSCVNGHARTKGNVLPMGQYYRCRQCVLVRTHRSRGVTCSYERFCKAASHLDREEKR